jgi:hypothetical protein
MEVLFDIFSTTVDVQGIVSPIRQYYFDMNTQFGKGFFSGMPKMDYTKLKKLVNQYDTMNSETTRKAELVPEITRSGTYNFYKYNSLVKIAKTILDSLELYNDYGAKSNPNQFWVYLIKRVIDKYDTYMANQITRLSKLSRQQLFDELKGAFFSSPEAQTAFTKDYDECIKSGCITMGSPVSAISPSTPPKPSISSVKPLQSTRNIRTVKPLQSTRNIRTVKPGRKNGGSRKTKRIIQNELYKSIIQKAQTKEVKNRY